jgi:hypothetical protein
MSAEMKRLSAIFFAVVFAVSTYARRGGSIQAISST